MSESLYPCPCCGFLEFNEPAGSYGICSICGWEDDHVQLAHPFMRGGANGGSLFDCQQEILKEIPAEIREYEGDMREINWRPLRKEDFRADAETPKTGFEYFNSAAEILPSYYWEEDNRNK
jgi:hypothetical protein